VKYVKQNCFFQTPIANTDTIKNHNNKKQKKITIVESQDCTGTGEEGVGPLIFWPTYFEGVTMGCDKV
jgi:hypothetical protein